MLGLQDEADALVKVDTIGCRCPVDAFGLHLALEDVGVALLDFDAGSGLGTSRRMRNSDRSIWSFERSPPPAVPRRSMNLSIGSAPPGTRNLSASFNEIHGVFRNRTANIFL
jgi:hypothetical protein